MEPIGARPGDIGRISITLRDTSGREVSGMKVDAEIRTGNLSRQISLDPAGEYRFAAAVPLDSGFHSVRVFLKGKGTREFALNGFWVRPVLEKAAERDALLEFVPMGLLRSIPWLDHLSGVILGIAAAVALGIAWRRRSKEPARAPDEAAVPPVALAFASLGALSMPLGAYWDISFHFSKGRETFFSPPHLLIYGGILLVLAALAFGLRSEVRIAGWRGLFRKASPASLAALFLTLQLASAPFDELWHFLFGLDVGIWSPPHALLIAGGFAACLSLARLPTTGPILVSRLLRTLLLAGALLIANIFLSESEYPFPAWHVSRMRPDAVYPLLMLLFSLLVFAHARSYAGFRFSLTAAAAAYLAIRLSVPSMVSAAGLEAVPRFPPWLVLPILLAVSKEFLASVFFRSHFQGGFGSKELHV